MEFVPATTLVAMLAKAHSDGTLDEQWTALSRPKLLIIDELGSLPFEANAAYLLFQLVSRRYEKGSILITSNRSMGERGSVSGDPIVATTILVPPSMPHSIETSRWWDPPISISAHLCSILR